MALETNPRIDEASASQSESTAKTGFKIIEPAVKALYDAFVDFKENRDNETAYDRYENAKNALEELDNSELDVATFLRSPECVNMFSLESTKNISDFFNFALSGISGASDGLYFTLNAHASGTGTKNEAEKEKRQRENSFLNALETINISYDTERWVQDKADAFANKLFEDGKLDEFLAKDKKSRKEFLKEHYSNELEEMADRIQSDNDNCPRHQAEEKALTEIEERVSAAAAKIKEYGGAVRNDNEAAIEAYAARNIAKNTRTISTKIKTPADAIAAAKEKMMYEAGVAGFFGYLNEAIPEGEERLAELKDLREQLEGSLRQLDTIKSHYSAHVDIAEINHADERIQAVKDKIAIVNEIIEDQENLLDLHKAVLDFATSGKHDFDKMTDRQITIAASAALKDKLQAAFGDKWQDAVITMAEAAGLTKEQATEFIETQNEINTLTTKFSQAADSLSTNATITITADNPYGIITFGLPEVTYLIFEGENGQGLTLVPQFDPNNPEKNWLAATVNLDAEQAEKIPLEKGAVIGTNSAAKNYEGISNALMDAKSDDALVNMVEEYDKANPDAKYGPEIIPESESLGPYNLQSTTAGEIETSEAPPALKPNEAQLFLTENKAAIIEKIKALASSGEYKHGIPEKVLAQELKQEKLSGPDVKQLISLIKNDTDLQKEINISPSADTNIVSNEDLAARQRGRNIGGKPEFQQAASGFDNKSQPLQSTLASNGPGMAQPLT